MSAIKTSLTHPLAIHAVTVASGGKIGMALCPGKRQPHAVTGPWDRDLAIDIGALKDFGTNLLVTLMEAHELVASAVPAETMRRAALGAGIAWLHLPIVDFQAPGADFETLWRVHGAEVRALVRGGGTVVFHCRGGRGRSGTLAARLLVELGMAPADAIATVRAVNPLAMETKVQEAHIATCRTTP